MIEKITDQNLERYDSRLKEWCDRKFFEKGNYGKYETIEEASAVTFYPAPNTPLEGKVKFSFKETPPASGDKGPENPSTITGVMQAKVTRCGANILPIKGAGNTYNGSIAQVNYTNNGNGTYTFSGTASGNGNTSGTEVSRWDLLALEFPKGSYSVGFIENSTTVKLTIRIIKNGITTYPQATGGSPYSFTIDENTTDVLIYFQVATGTIYNETATPYLCVEGAVVDSVSESADYTINFGGTYYGGSIDLATGVMTVTHYGYAFTGTEAGWWERTELENTVRFAAYGSSWGSIIQATKNHNTSVCSHFTLNYSFSSDTPHFYVGDTGNQYYFYPDHTLSREDWKAWLAQQYAAGHPLTTSFELATPFTISLTPVQILSLAQTDKYTPRLNTVYTDADSIQISYLKSPIRDEYEKTQAILSLGGNS